MRKVLLVEDERSILKALSFELEDAGYEVFYASNYQEAVSYINALDCDIIISDLFFNTEYGDGIQLLHQAQRNGKNIPFIAITAFPETKLALQARQILNDRFFEKPFNTGQLKQKIIEILKD